MRNLLIGFIVIAMGLALCTLGILFLKDIEAASIFIAGLLICLTGCLVWDNQIPTTL